MALYGDSHDIYASLVIKGKSLILLTVDTAELFYTVYTCARQYV